MSLTLQALTVVYYRFKYIFVKIVHSKYCKALQKTRFFFPYKAVILNISYITKI